jgi:predicted ATPase/DNA-binding winged helix-turn-helix (wHTH) protein
MEVEETPRSRGGILFGQFRLFPAERLLEREGVPLRIGGRALDILIVLIARAGEVVSHQELGARVWQGVTVEPGSLRFHVAALRKLLGDGQDGARYVTNVAGRGYCFVAAVSRSSPAAVAAGAALERETAEPLHKLPPLLTRMVGRDDAVNAIAANLVAHRFVTVVGSGGIGKTTVAVAVAHALLASFDGAVCFVQLATLRDPASVAGALATTLGLRTLSNDPAAAVIGHLRGKRMLLVLDCCEQIINSAAECAERLFMECRDVHVLATSREPLGAEGEHVYRLPPLGIPPDDGSITVAWVLSFPAAQLFVERVGAHHRFELNAADAPTVAEICRKLDGVALAFVPTLAKGLAMTGRFEEALVTIDDVIERTNTNGDLVNMPNMLIAKGDILAAMPACELAGAERCYLAAVDMARSQYALSWELRAAISLARLWNSQGRGGEARHLLAPVYGQFSEGFGSLDLLAARELLYSG